VLLGTAVKRMDTQISSSQRGRTSCLNEIKLKKGTHTHKNIILVTAVTLLISVLILPVPIHSQTIQGGVVSTFSSALEGSRARARAGFIQTRHRPIQTKSHQKSNSYFILASADQFEPSFQNNHKRNSMSNSPKETGFPSSSSLGNQAKDDDNELGDDTSDDTNNLAMFTARDVDDSLSLEGGEMADTNNKNDVDDDDISYEEGSTCFETSPDFSDDEEEAKKYMGNIETHYIFLIHGWLGNSLEMSYVEEAIQKAESNAKLSSSSSSSSSDNSEKSKKSNRIVIHSVTSNNGQTSDGIANGGIRVAEEIQNFIKRDLQMYNNINKASTATSTGSTSDVSSSNSLSSSSTSEKITKNISISFVGNSLGGLYARYALSCIPQQLEIASMTIKLHYSIFCTTVTPHLGVASNTFVKIPRALEYVVGNVLLSTGRDLFRVGGDASDTLSDKSTSTLKRSSSKEEGETLIQNEEILKQSHHQANDLIYKMSVEDNFLQPLLAFKKRIAYINAFGSDFQVPTSTAAFLDEDSTYPHHVLELETKDIKDADDNASFIATIVKTETDHGIINANEDWFKNKSSNLAMSNKLDALGWRKVFIDTRDKIPLPSLKIGNLFKKKKTNREVWDDFVQSKKKDEGTQEETDDKTRVIATVESKDMYRLLTVNDRFQVPAGHSVLVANSKNGAYEQFSSQGRPVMDRMARDMIRELL
jgi:hypothetical protein